MFPALAGNQKGTGIRLLLELLAFDRGVGCISGYRYCCVVACSQPPPGFKAPLVLPHHEDSRLPPLCPHSLPYHGAILTAILQDPPSLFWKVITMICYLSCKELTALPDHGTCYFGKYSPSSQLPTPSAGNHSSTSWLWKIYSVLFALCNFAFLF